MRPLQVKQLFEAEEGVKAAVYYENGGPEVLRYEDAPEPRLHPRGVLIAVEAIAVEGGDILNRWRGPLTSRPHIVGYQAAGTILEVGALVEHLRPGQRVATLDAHGSHAELRCVPARNCWPIPDGLDSLRASVIPVTFGTAHDCLFEFGRLQAGETVLVQAGASGVGVAAIQLARRAGAGLILATASSTERLERLRPLGLDHGVNYLQEDVPEAVRRLTDGRGADVIVDSVGGATLQGSIQSLAYRGRVSMVGAAGRQAMVVDVGAMMAGNQSLSGVFLGAEIASDRVHDTIQGLMEDVARGDLEVIVDRTYPLSQAAEAHAYIESRAAVGRVVLIP